MTLDMKVLEAELGPGPMRFVPQQGERDVAEQLASLTEKEKECFDALKGKWEKTYPDQSLSDLMYLLFARCSPGRKKFQQGPSWIIMKKFDHRYLNLTADSMEDQLLSKCQASRRKKAIIPSFTYIPPVIFPAKTTTQEIIDNLAYCMNHMCDTCEKDASEGIGFLAYMKDWKMTNFSVNYCYQFMMMLQGRIPVRVRLFLIVDPPGWFDKIWYIMKPMLASEFRKKVHVIPEADISKFLQDGFETYLPDDMVQSKADTQALVEDFVTYRKKVEGSM